MRLLAWRDAQGRRIWTCCCHAPGSRCKQAPTRAEAEAELEGLRAKLAKAEADRMQAVEDRVVAERARAGAEKAAEEAVRRCAEQNSTLRQILRLAEGEPTKESK